MHRKTVIRRIGLTALTTALAVVGLCPRTMSATTVANIPEVIAKVNGVPITRDRFLQQYLDFHAVYRLENLIATTLLEEEAKKRNISVSESEINTKVATLKKVSGMISDNSFNSWLLQNEWTENRYRDKARLVAMIEKVFADEANVTDAKVENYYNENKVKFTLQPIAQMWLLRTVTKSSADKAIDMAKAGKQFSEIGAALTDVQVATQSQPYPISNLPNDLKALVEKATPGQVIGPYTQPLDTRNPDGPKMYMVFRVESKQDQRVRTFNEVKDEIRQALFDQAVFGELGLWNQWIDKALKSATIERNITFSGAPKVESVIGR